MCTNQYYFDAISDVVAKSVSKLLQQDKYLCDINAHEIAINHRIAIYLEEILNYYGVLETENLSVDIEYNRISNVNNPSSILENKTQFEINCVDHNNNEFLKQKIVRPDIIIHERDRENNVLWIEIKIGDDTLLCEEDIAKAYYACTQLRFKYGASVLINHTENTLVIFLIDDNSKMIEYHFEINRDTPYLLKAVFNDAYTPRPIFIKEKIAPIYW